jgi:hypothetical protein
VSVVFGFSEFGAENVRDFCSVRLPYGTDLKYVLGTKKELDRLLGEKNPQGTVRRRGLEGTGEVGRVEHGRGGVA